MIRSVRVGLCICVVGIWGCAGARFLPSPHDGTRYRVVYQPSHQADTGENFNEAEVSNAIAEAAIAAASPAVEVYKVWSYDIAGLHHPRAGSNTKIEHSSAVDDSGRISGYAYEIRESNRLKPDIFIAIHNNGATKRNGCWGYVHEGDSLEEMNRKLAAFLVASVCEASGLEDLGVHGDSEPNRNDYRCASTGKLAFYSLDEHVNQAPVRVLLEIGDNDVSRKILLDPEIQQRMGRAIQQRLEELILP